MLNDKQTKKLINKYEKCNTIIIEEDTQNEILKFETRLEGFKVPTQKPTQQNIEQLFIAIQELKTNMVSMEDRINSKIVDMEDRINSKIIKIENDINKVKMYIINMEDKINSRIDEVKSDIINMEDKINSRIDKMDLKIDNLKDEMNNRFDKLEIRVATLESFHQADFAAN